jgi:DNA polymerase-1
VATSIFDWRELPFSELWCWDFEYYPGKGKANGGRDGDPITPLCMAAIEMRTGRIVQLWQDEFGPFPPMRFDASALFFSYLLSAEYGCHIPLGWGQPACAIDAYVEFRHLMNDGAAKAEDRPKGFYSLNGALQYFCENGVDTAHKTEMRDRIIQGPPFSTEEREVIQLYALDDARSLAVVVKHLIPTIRSLPHAMGRAKFMWPIAQQERRGIPVDLPFLGYYRANESAIKRELALTLGAPFGVYEFDEEGRPHWRKHLWEGYVKRHAMIHWPRHPSGALDTDDQTFRDMEGLYPQIGPLRELRYTLSKMRLNDLAVGTDGRNRTLLGPYGSKTGRNQPSNSRYIFGPAKWLRFLITPPPGRVLIHRDFEQQEPKIAALRSGDPALLVACESGDVYLGIAKQLGFAPPDATAKTHEAVRTMFKTVVLGIIYGLGPRTLASRIGVSLFEAAEILARLHARFRIFEDYAQRVLDQAGLRLELSTQFGWVMQCQPGINPRTVRNFPIQSTGSEILHVACILAERRGIEVIAPVHDALMAEADLDRADEVSAALDRAMRDASSVVLRGYELSTDVQVIGPGKRFCDKRGAEMWGTIERLLAKLKAESA